MSPDALRRLLAGALAASAVALGAPGADGTAAPACAAGRFVTGAPLLPEGAAGGDVVEIAAGKIAIEGACGPADVRLAAGAAGTTRVKASFKRCRGAPGKVKLVATLDAACRGISGTVKAARTKPRWRQGFAGALDESVAACAWAPGARAAAPPAEARAARRRLVPNTPARQEGFFLALWGLVSTEYLYPDFRGVDWDAVRTRVLGEIRAGLGLEEFYETMASVIEDLGDEHSYFLSPDEVKAIEIERTGGEAFVGIGITASRVGDSDAAVVTGVFPGSAAAAAGLASHDLIVAVDGGPVFDEDGGWLTPKEEGVSFELTVETPGEAARTISLARGLVAGFRPIDHCRVAGTGVAYLAIPTFFDETVDDRLRGILRKLAAGGPLDGLVLDVRTNTGGSSTVALPVLGFFTGGVLGELADRHGSYPISVDAEDVAGSQSVPLVVLAGEGTVSFGELFTGLLQSAGRAAFVGEPTAGNTETLYGWVFRDGAEIWLAAAAFDPEGPLPAGAWEEQGVLPDAVVASAWETFTAADDPGLARAVELLAGP